MNPGVMASHVQAVASPGGAVSMGDKASIWGLMTFVAGDGQGMVVDNNHRGRKTPKTVPPPNTLLRGEEAPGPPVPLAY
jgi:hypothetical protein